MLTSLPLLTTLHDNGFWPERLDCLCHYGLEQVEEGLVISAVVEGHVDAVVSPIALAHITQVACT